MLVLFVFAIAAFMFLFVVFSQQADITYLFDFSRHEWFRELRRDYHTSWQQFWKDWRLFKRFAKENGAWIYASIFGTIGLVITAILLVVNLPQELKAGVRNVYTDHVAQNERTFVTREDGIDTRTKVLSEINPLAEDEAVLVDVRTVSFERVVQDPPPLVPQPVEPLPIQPPEPMEIDLNQAFSDFAPTPPREQPKQQDLVVTIGLVPELEDAPFEVTSIDTVVDVEDALGRLRGDSWSPEDKQRVPRPQPIFLKDRQNVVQLSMHERERIELPQDSIRIRPGAAGREVSTGIHVRKSVPKRATAGSELTYDVEVTNPNAGTVSKMIVEEIVPVGWRILDAEPMGKLLGDDVLRWDVDGLAADQTQRFRIRVLVGGNETATSRTIVTTGASVEARLTVAAADIEPTIPVEPAPIIPNSSAWQASEPTIAPPERDLTIPPPAAITAPEVIAPPVISAPPTISPPTITNRIQPDLEMDVIVPNRVGLGEMQVQFVVRNTGTVAIDDARILLWVASQLSHARGNQLSHPVGPLAPNQSRTLTIRLRANVFGKTISKAELRAGTTAYDRESIEFTVAAQGAPVTPAGRWRGTGR